MWSESLNPCATSPLSILLTGWKKDLLAIASCLKEWTYNMLANQSSLSLCVMCILHKLFPWKPWKILLCNDDSRKTTKQGWKVRAQHQMFCDNIVDQWFWNQRLVVGHIFSSMRITFHCLIFFKGLLCIIFNTQLYVSCLVFCLCWCSFAICSSVMSLCLLWACLFPLPCALLSPV